jgi:hypothetical protein
VGETSDFCRYQSERLLALARGCDDPVLRKQLTIMASKWVARAKEKSPGATQNDEGRSLVE